MKVGDRVRVNASVTVFHYPNQQNTPVDVAGMEGEIVALKDEHDGNAISANYPYYVAFGNRFRSHFRADELTQLSAENS